MATFNSTYGSEAMFASIANTVNNFENSGTGVDVHTINLSLNGQHGEFDLLVIGSDENMDIVTLFARAYRRGGISHERIEQR